MQNIELSTMRSVDPAAIDRDTLVDIRDVTVDTSLPTRERSPQIGNPYCYKCGKYVVKVEFSDAGTSLTQRLAGYIASKA